MEAPGHVPSVPSPKSGTGNKTVSVEPLQVNKVAAARLCAWSKSIEIKAHKLQSHNAGLVVDLFIGALKRACLLWTLPTHGHAAMDSDSSVTLFFLFRFLF